MTRTARRVKTAKHTPKARPARRSGPARRKTSRSRGPVPRKAANWLHARVRDVRRGQNVRATLVGALASLVLFAVLGLWLSGHLGGVLSSVAGVRDRALLAAGFGVSQIEIVDQNGKALSPSGVQAVRQALAVEEGELVFSVNLPDARRRVEELGWIARARIVRQLPDRLTVIVQARRPFALWQSGGRWHVIGANGDVIIPAKARDHASLPLAVGTGAPQKLQAFIAQVQHYPGIARHVYAYVRVGGRRWNLHLRSGADLMLPAGQPGQALEMIENDKALLALLDRPLARLDMRLPGRIYVRPQALPAGEKLPSRGQLS